LSGVNITGAAGGDTFVLDFSNATTYPSGGFTFTGGTGNNSFQIVGSAGNDTIVAGTAGVTFNGVAVNDSNFQTLLIDPGAGNDSLTVNSGTVVLPAAAEARDFSAISVAAGAKLELAASQTSAGRTVLVVNSLSIAQGGLLDLANNDLIVRNGSGGSVATWLDEGFNYGGPAWAGATGIISSSAAATPRLMALGDLTENTAGQSFDRLTVYAGDVLVKYTYIGDANLDGKVDGSDYSLIDGTFVNEQGSKTAIGGWFMGDFNRDGVVDGSDYSLIDNAFNNQGAPLSSTVAVAAAPASVVAPAAPAAPAVTRSEIPPRTVPGSKSASRKPVVARTGFVMPPSTWLSVDADTRFEAGSPFSSGTSIADQLFDADNGDALLKSRFSNRRITF
jgi:hypothetical protein